MFQTATVLVIEDHPTLLLHSVGVVEDAGFKALAADGVAAAAVLLDEHQEIKTVFADLDAPGCDTLLADVRRCRPAVRLILTATSVSRSSTRIPRGAAFFPKPFSLDDIQSTLLRFAA